MKYQAIAPAFLTMMLSLLVACAPKAPGIYDPHVSVSPSPCELTVDDNRKAELNLDIHIPKNYFSRRSRLVITPQVVAGADSVVATMRPVVLDAGIFRKKMLRRHLLEGYVDPYALVAKRVDTTKPVSLSYQETVQLPEPYQQGRVDAVLSSDGCGSCTGFEELTLATLVVPEAPVEPEPPVVEEPEPESLGLDWMEPAFVVREKMMQGEGTAHLQFIINKYDIVPELGNNRAELEDIVAKLEPIVNDSLATITSIAIYGMASADGPLSLNTPLSANRANSAKQWLAERLQLSSDIVAAIKTGSRPEGWQPVLEAMTADGHPDSLKVKNILTRYADKNDDVQEYYIRRLPCWPAIRDRYLQKDRKVDYTYAWTIRSFTTDQELIDMYRTRPDAFNEEELLRVAQLAADDSSRMQVYRYTIGRFPASKTAANNLAILLERQGNYDEARRVWEAFKTIESYQKQP